MPSPVSSLEAHLGYWLRFVSNHVSHAFSQKLDTRGVTLAEWVFLRELFDRDGVAPSLLAARLGMTRGAISKHTEKLIAKGFVTRTFEEHDRRYQVLSITSAGRAIVPELAALADANDAEFFESLDPAERAVIENAMRKVVRSRGLKSLPVD